MSKLLIAFVPVLHAGYLNFFKSHQRSELRLLHPEVYLENFKQLAREIRAIPLLELIDPLYATKLFSKVGIADHQWLQAVSSESNSELDIVMPDEDVSRFVGEKYFGQRNVTYHSVFLRYDLPATFHKNIIKPDRVIDFEGFDVDIMKMGFEAAEHSPDWWRQVGSVLLQNNCVLDVAYNRHLPHEQSLYAFGDPRNNFQPGEHVNITAAHHPEKALISRAASRGDSTSGASMYATTFPCPSCAFDIAMAGIKHLYYSEGYSNLQAEETLRDAGVEIIFVK